MTEPFRRTRTVRLDGGGERLHLRRAVLSVETGPDQGLEVTLPDGPALIGRAADAELVLSDPAVSRHHARLSPGEKGWRIEDLGSKAGILLGGNRLEVAVLEDGAEIQLGESQVRFRLVDEVLLLEDEDEAPIDGILGNSAGIQRLRRLIRKVAPVDLTVLVRGESGSGKEAVARALHEHSSRADAPFIVIDCTLLDSEHLRSELFGHLRGAFTGADRDRAGAFERADGGTLFLDEVGDLPPALQPMLLRALEEGAVTPLGGEEERRFQVRVVAATHRDLPGMIANGEYRQDLFYRLAGVELDVPPLRARGEDVALLAEHFLEGAAAFAPETVQALREHPWPGNVRELRNAVRRGAALCEGRIVRVEDLGLREAPAGAIAGDPTETLAESEARLIRAALERHGGNRSAAARELGIDRVTLWRRAKKLGLAPSED